MNLTYNEGILGQHDYYLNIDQIFSKRKPMIDTWNESELLSHYYYMHSNNKNMQLPIMIIHCFNDFLRHESVGLLNNGYPALFAAFAYHIWITKYVLFKKKYITRCSVRSSTICTGQLILQLYFFVFKIEKVLSEQISTLRKWWFFFEERRIHFSSYFVFFFTWYCLFKKKHNKPSNYVMKSYTFYAWKFNV